MTLGKSLSLSGLGSLYLYEWGDELELSGLKVSFQLWHVFRFLPSCSNATFSFLEWRMSWWKWKIPSIASLQESLNEIEACCCRKSQNPREPREHSSYRLIIKNLITIIYGDILLSIPYIVPLSSLQPCKICAHIIHIVQRKKWRHRVVKKPAWSYTAIKYWNSTGPYSKASLRNLRYHLLHGAEIVFENSN